MHYCADDGDDDCCNIYAQRGVCKFVNGDYVANTYRKCTQQSQVNVKYACEKGNMRLGITRGRLQDPIELQIYNRLSVGSTCNRFSCASWGAVLQFSLWTKERERDACITAAILLIQTTYVGSNLHTTIC